MTVTRGAPLRIDDLLDAAACAGLMGLASATVDGAPIGVVDLEGRLVIGERAGLIAARRHPIGLDGTLLGAIEAPEQVPESLLALLAKSLELTMAGARQAAANARMEHELSIGRRIQLALLPHRFPEVDGWSFAAAYEAAREVGGDLYDAFPVRGKADRVGLVVADVTGKGIPAALLMADCRALLHAATDNAPSPGRRPRARQPHPRDGTADLVVRDGVPGCARDGHRHPPLRLGGPRAAVARARERRPRAPRGGRPAARRVRPGGLRGSARSSSTRATSSRSIPDGVTDARDPEGAFFGEERLEASLRAAAGRAPEAVATALVEAVRVFRAGAEPFDDLCLLLAGRDPA